MLCLDLIKTLCYELKYFRFVLFLLLSTLSVGAFNVGFVHHNRQLMVEYERIQAKSEALDVEHRTLVLEYESLQAKSDIQN